MAGARPANAEVAFMGGRDEPGHDDLLGCVNVAAQGERGTLANCLGGRAARRILLSPCGRGMQVAGSSFRAIAGEGSHRRPPVEALGSRSTGARRGRDPDAARLTHYIRNTPKRVAWTGAFRQAESASARTRRVSDGAMTFSNDDARAVSQLLWGSHSWLQPPFRRLADWKVGGRQDCPPHTI